ncbi:MAG TPA: N-acetyltransferase [Pseudomonadales bacterium]|nr:N-acetyltransferase [Pseudomonadales bacterium]
MPDPVVIHRVVIRRATRSDLLQLEQLEQRCFTSDRLSRRSMLHALSSSTAQLWVVDDNARNLLGSGLLFFRKRSSVCRLYSIAVDTAARGRGIAQQLLAVLERAAAERGATAMRLEVREDNPAAISLYRKNGYQVFGEIAGFYEDGCNALRMEKMLQPVGL